MKVINFHFLIFFQNKKWEKKSHFSNVPDSTPLRIRIMIFFIFIAQDYCTCLRDYKKFLLLSHSSRSWGFRFSLICYLHSQRQKATKVLFVLISGFFFLSCRYCKILQRETKKRKSYPRIIHLLTFNMTVLDVDNFQKQTWMRNT